MAGSKAAQEKRLAALAAKTEKQKKALVDQLRRTPIVQVSCERTGIGRATYYQWRKSDRVFARAADKAIQAGEFFINDLAESKLITMIQNGNLTAIIFWLKHNHPKYAVTTRHIHQYELVSDPPSTEDMVDGEKLIHGVLYKDVVESVVQRLSPGKDKIKEVVEKELDQAEENEPARKRRESFEEGAP